jgi:hypothetical protein
MMKKQFQGMPPRTPCLTLKMLRKATPRRTTRLRASGPKTTVKAMRCERGACVLYILLGWFFVKKLDLARAGFA